MADNGKRILNFKKFYFALLQSSIPLVVTDAAGKIIFANKGIGSITGYSTEEVLGKTPSIWGRQMGKEFYKNLWDTIKKQKKPFVGELINKNKNGQLFPVGIDIAPILNEKGEIEFFVSTEYDISKIKEAERAQEEFVALVSHQLRTPLTAVKWLIEILLREKYGVLTDKQEEAMINIYGSNERLINLVNDLLSVSRVRSGSIAVSPAAINLIEDTKQIITIYRPQAVSRKQKIVLKHRKIPKMVVIDPVLYSQIVQNLLSNALIYSEANSEISISLDRAGDLIIVRIANSGDPIPLIEQKSLFSKFFRGEQAKKMNTHGTGLGLFIVKEAVEKLGGKIGFSSTKERTEFYFTFPLKEPAVKPIHKIK